MKKIDFNNLTLIPALIAERVCAHEYLGEYERDKIESLRLRMTNIQINEFADICEAICKKAYKDNRKWFKDCVKAKTPDKMYMWISHWLHSYLKNPEAFKKHIMPSDPRIYVGIKQI